MAGSWSIGRSCDYRDLFWFLVWRGIKVRYAQSALGVGWAVIQPVFSMIVFTIVFGALAGIKSDGAHTPSSVSRLWFPGRILLTPVTEGTSSLVTNANMISKVYFPRLVLPLSAVVAKLVDFGIAMILLFALMAFYGLVPTFGVFVLPLLILLMMLTAAGLGMWLTALAVQYRDVNYGLNFVVQLLMYAAPVVYPASLVPQRFQYVYALNPMVGVIEGFRGAVSEPVPSPGTLSLLVQLSRSLSRCPACCISEVVSDCLLMSLSCQWGFVHLQMVETNNWN